MRNTWIFHLNKYLIFVLNHLNQSPFCCSTGNMCMQCTQFYPHFHPPSLSLSLSFLSVSPSLSVSWTSCSLALKYAALCRSVDHRSALHPESECNVNDMIPSKATLTLLSFSCFKSKGWLHETMKSTVGFTLTQIAAALADTNIHTPTKNNPWAILVWREKE